MSLHDARERSVNGGEVDVDSRRSDSSAKIVVGREEQRFEVIRKGEGEKRSIGRSRRLRKVNMRYEGGKDQKSKRIKSQEKL